VTGVALALVEESGDDPVMAFLTGTLHDVTKLTDESVTPHEESGAALAGDLLRGDLPPATIHAIQAAIRKESGSSLGDVLHDADKLDKIGAAGVVRRIAEHAEQDDLRAALERVQRDLDEFPAMAFDASRTLARHKRDFLNEFLPEALAALDARG
jgi:HD superfamily phosphodiesterase